MQVRVSTFFAVLLSGFLLALSISAHADPLEVKTAQGKARGKFINDSKVKAFLGLPYAAPPVGDQRWKAPAPPALWKGTRDATSYGDHCYQAHVYSDMVFQDRGPSEDCLFLNVFTPAGAKAGSKLPVMFWIHGGGYSGGSASEPRHNGDALPTKGVVLVTINYRLGILGFLATGELAKEANGVAGNYGMLDMIAALRWVRSNIANFGGDPGNVTIFGESAGSFAVSTLMAVPSAQPLFHKAIGESGGAFSGTLPIPTLETAIKLDEEWTSTLADATLAQLRAMPADKIIDAALQKGAPHFGPIVDGQILTEQVSDTYAAGKQSHIPLLAGWNRDENPSLSTGMTADLWKTFAKDHFGDLAGDFLTFFPADTDEQAVRSAIDYGSDQFIAFGTWKWIEAHRKTGDSPVYRYHFELAAPPSKFHAGTYAFHSDDIEYVFGALDTRPGADWRPEDRKLSEQIMSYWTNFAKTGDPNGPGLPVWPKFGADDQIIHLDNPVTSGPSKVEARYEFLLKAMPAPAVTH